MAARLDQVEPAPPTDAELMPEGEVPLWITLRVSAGQDREMAAEAAVDRIMQCLRDCGEHDLANRLR